MLPKPPVEASLRLVPHPSVARLLPSPQVVLRVPLGEDVRPLYLIPWDPSVDQVPDMRDYCRNILLARVAQHAAAQVGQTAAPALVSLEGRALLREATSGMSARWQER